MTHDKHDPRFRVRLKRWVEQTTEIIVRAPSGNEAVNRACHYAKASRLAWRDGAVERGPAPAGSENDAERLDG